MNMAEVLCEILKWTAIMLVLSLFLGLYRPWWVLWWLSVQNRLKVIVFYGGGALVIWLVRIFIC